MPPCARRRPRSSPSAREPGRLAEAFPGPEWVAVTPTPPTTCSRRGCGPATWSCSSRAVTAGCAGSATGSRPRLATSRRHPCRRPPESGVSREGRPARGVDLAAHLAVRHPAVHQVPRQAGLRPVHPRRRPDLAPHQARHADHGRRRHPRRDARSPTSSPTLLTRNAAHRDGLLVLFLMVGLGLRRLPRRLHQDQQAAQPRPAQPRRSCSARRSSASSSPSWRCSSPTSTYRTPASPLVSFVRDTNFSLALGGAPSSGSSSSSSSPTHDRRRLQRR